MLGEDNRPLQAAPLLNRCFQILLDYSRGVWDMSSGTSA